MNNKNGFVLIEIIVSVMLLSIVGIALLKINSNQKNLYTIASKKLEFSKYISIVVDRHSINLHNKDLNLYDLVKNKYVLKDDALIKILKDSKVKYTQKYKSIVSFKRDDNSPKINILIDEIKISDKSGSSKYITINM